MLELVISFAVMAILTAVAVPAYRTVVANSQLTAATAPLNEIAHVALAQATAHNQMIPSANEVSSAVASSGNSFTPSPSSDAAPAPSTSYGVVSYDTTDATTVTPNAVGLAMASQGGGCAFTRIAEGSVTSWTTSSGSSCNGSAALAGTGAPTTTTTTTTTPPPQLTAPSAPTNVVVAPGNASATLTWSVPADGGSPITGYSVYYSMNGGSSWTASTCSGTTTTCTLAGLSNGTAYLLRVTASNAIGTSVPSNAVSVVPTATVVAPAAPGSVAVSYTKGTTSATVSWATPTNDGYGNAGGQEITLYSVAGSPSGSCTSSASSSPATTCSVLNLNPGTTYTFTVTATNAAGLTSAASSPSSSITVITAPEYPTAVTAAYTAGSTSASVSWTAPANDGMGSSIGANITKYVVSAVSAPYSCTVTGSPAATSCVIANLAVDAAYTFTVRATNSAGYTGPASLASNSTGLVATVPDAPPTPTVAYTAGNTTATVSWTPPASDGLGSSTGAGITTYVVTGTPAATCTSSAPSAPTTNCVVSGLTAGTTYTFTVVATNTAGLVSPASGASLPVTVTQPPGAPTNVVATGANAQAAVSWTAPSSDGGAVITSYTVTSSPGGFVCSTSGTTSCTVTGLTNGTAYTFTVTATNVAGTSVPSLPSNVTTPFTLPGAPTNAVATGGNAQATISWTAPSSNGGSTITGYTATSSPGGLTCTTSSSTSCTVTGLTNGTSYTFTVTATNAAGTGPASLASNAVTPITVPSAPTSVSAAAGNATASISWSAPSSNGGSAITGYTVTSSPGGLTCTTSSTSCTVTGLTNGTAYTFTVTATNAAGTGPASAPSSAVTPLGPPSSPTGATATAGNATAAVSWTAPSSNGGSAITGYTVTSSPGGLTCTTSGTSCTLTGLTNGTAYTFTVTATNAVGTGPASSPSNAVTPAAPPGAPTITSTTASSTTSAAVIWTAPPDNGSVITSYTVTASPGGATCTTSSLSCTITGLTLSSVYTFTVTATNAIGAGPASAAAPTTPSNLYTAATQVNTTSGRSVAYGNGVYVSLGDYSPILGGNTSSTTEVSTNGTTWAAGGALPATQDWTSVTYGNGTFVAVAWGSTTAAYSTNNGASWATATLPSASQWQSVTYGNGYFVTVGGWANNTAAYSTNGVSWTASTLPTSTEWMSVAYGNGAFVAVGGWYGNYAAYSTNDGATWTAATMPTNDGWTSITYGNGIFVAVGWSGHIAYSTTNDGASWSLAPTPITFSPLDITYGDGEFLTAGYNTAQLESSINGTTWNTVVALPSASLWDGIAVGPTTAVITAFNGTAAAYTPVGLLMATAPSAPSGVTVTPASDYSMAISWPASAANGAAIGSYVVTSSGGQTCVSTGTSCIVYSLTNGTAYTFTVVAYNAVGPSASTDTSASTYMYYVPLPPTDETAATTSSTTVAVSWSPPTFDGGTPVTLYTVTASPSGLACTTTGLTCTIGGLSSGTLYSFSVTATNAIGTSVSSPFTTLSMPIWPAGSAVAYGNGVYVALDGGGNYYSYVPIQNVQVSTNGISWTSSATAMPVAANWDAITYGGGSTFVAVAYGSDYAAISTNNGTTWALEYLPVSQNWDTVTYNPSNGYYTALASYGAEAAYSPNGSTWYSAGLPAAPNWSSVAAGDGYFVAIGGCWGNYAAYSTNGSSWTGVSLPDTNCWSSVVYDGGSTFVAISEGGNVDYSTNNGASWVSAGSPMGGTIAAINVNGTLYAFGPSTGTVYTSTNITTWTSSTTLPPTMGPTPFMAISAAYGPSGILVVNSNAGEFLPAPVSG